MNLIESSQHPLTVIGLGISAAMGLVVIMFPLWWIAGLVYFGMNDQILFALLWSCWCWIIGLVYEFAKGQDGHFQKNIYSMSLFEEQMLLDPLVEEYVATMYYMSTMKYK